MQPLFRSLALRRSFQSTGRRWMSHQFPALNIEQCVGLDIGGSLAKFVVLDAHSIMPSQKGLLRATVDRMKQLPRYRSDLTMSTPLGPMHFIPFETSSMNYFVDELRDVKFGEACRQMSTTGGGAYKYAEMVNKELRINLVPHDEVNSLVRG